MRESVKRRESLSATAPPRPSSLRPLPFCSLDGWIVPTATFLFLLASVLSAPSAAAENPTSSPRETLATGEPDAGPLVRWAIVPSINDSCRLLADLLTVKFVSNIRMDHSSDGDFICP